MHVAMPNYRRARVAGGTYFFTVAIADRSKLLLGDRIDDLRDACHAAHGARPVTINAIVILPNHLQCLWTLPQAKAVKCIHRAAPAKRMPPHVSIIVVSPNVDISGCPMIAGSPSVVPPYEILAHPILLSFPYHQKRARLSPGSFVSRVTRYYLNLYCNCAEISRPMGL